MFAIPGPFLLEMLLPATGEEEMEPPPVLFHHFDLAACHFRSIVEEDKDPAVISSEFMNDINPIKIVLTDHAGLKDLGWKSEIDRQRRVEVWKRPLGVCIRMAGGAKGYSGGNIRVPQY